MTTQTISPLGVISDIPANRVPIDFWTEGQNVDFTDSRSRRSAGYQDITGPTLFTPIKTQWVEYAGNDYWLYAGPGGVGIWEGGVHVDVTPPGYITGGDQDGYNWALINGIPVLNWQGGSAWYWQPAAIPLPMIELPDWNPVQAGSMRAHKNFLIALDINDATGIYPEQVRWSGAAAPGDIPQVWTPDPANLAGDMTFSSIEGPVIDGKALRDDFVIYKGKGVYLMIYVGGQFVFQQRKLFTTTGILAKGCVAEWQGKHFVVTQGDIMMHNGVEAQSIADLQVRRRIFEDMNADFSHRTFCIHSAKRHEFMIAYAGADSLGWCDTLATWNYREQKWAFRLMADEVSDGAEGQYFYVVAGDEWDGDLQAWDDDVTDWGYTGSAPADDRTVLTVPGSDFLAGGGLSIDDNGIPIVAFLEWGSKDFDTPDRLKMLRRIWPKMVSDTPVTVQFRVGFQQSFGEVVSFTAWRDFHIGETDKLDFDVQGRLLTIQVRSIGGQIWELHAMELEFDLAGRY